MVALDYNHYDKFKEPENEHDSELDFDLVVIQELDGYLLPDLVADQEGSELSLLRKELVELYATS
jgi:hypothetical protein